ncbi:MFS general substrate transporter [Hypoxylon trugodes]|uniref:MFS general substrate transporter n=1 Tax=Hypoxylon trugodes TaxID=326681 RepID=UPI002195A7EA|nr:MFS general substrate transporter [Hypoxylon trugodes]KAI1393826.1 MFS general substrate transporter [Hypoxylon trugodes]
MAIKREDLVPQPLRSCEKVYLMDSGPSEKEPCHEADKQASLQCHQRGSFDVTAWSHDALTPPNHDLDGKTLSLSIRKDDCQHQSSLSSDLEKRGSGEDPRAHIFLGKPMSVIREIAFFTVVATANFTPHSGFHQALCILHIIGSDLGVTHSGQLVWLIAGYGLTGTFILLAGRLGDVYGHKLIFLVGNVWFALFSLAAGLAVYTPRPYAVFLFARIMQGVGPALLVPSAVALLGITYVPGQRKAMLFAMFGAMAPASAIISPAFTGLLALARWQYAFFALSLLLIFTTIAGVFVIPGGLSPEKGRMPHGGLGAICAELDVLGALTGVSGLVLISVSWNQASIHSWQDPYVPVLLMTGILLCVVFVFVEKHARKPLIPMEAINSGVAFILAAVFCGWGCFGIYIYYIWEFYEMLRGASPLLATAMHSPIFVSGIAAAITTGMIIHRVGPAVVMALALLAFTVGTTLIATAPIEQSYWSQTFLCNLIVTWGMDLSFPAATLMLSDLVSSEHQGIAASLVTTVVNYSGALALGVAGTVELHVNKGGKTSQDILKGYRGAWYVAIGLGVVGLMLCSIFTWKFSKRQRGLPRG